MYLFNGLLSRQVTGGTGSSRPGGTASSNASSILTSAVSFSLSATATPSSTSSSVRPPSTVVPTTQDDNSTSDSKAGIILPVLVTFVALLLVVFSIILCRSCRKKHKNPKYIPTKYLKSQWERWQPTQGQRLPQTNDHLERTRSSQPPAAFDVAAGGGNPGITVVGAGVDRNTSVRSVMTLPAYRLSALENEQVLGREGERGGIDTVVEFPEGADEEEQRREEEMEALYQVRLARRRENEERDERRRLRREARERSDWVALRELQNQSRTETAANAGRSVAELRAEHDRLKAERQRAVSSVSYGDLGVARHDGTRLRANSEESERQGLLGDAASIAASSRYHRRDHSSVSVISIDTMNSDLPSPGLTRSRANSRAESPLRRGSTNPSLVATDRAGSSPEIIDHETGSEDAPSNSPPGYENISLETPRSENGPLEPPPDYSSPVLDRGEAGPSIDSVMPTRDGPVGERIAQDTLPTHERRASRSPSNPPGSRDRRVSTRGVGGVPQLPSLRLGSLPSIVVDTGTPVAARQRRIDEEDT
ncbi:hypothetical protein PVAG01_07804 [Phlyctema vagabunda]|uniref:Uncharacterized protein n=1 Tax=Phlyctema vagabunda TaxID=108571 RepID=A0ABR4PDG2_9HELO